MTALIIILVVVVLLVLFFVSSYNTLVKLRNRVRDQWAQIEVVLKRRADLIPNLVETVKGYAGHEKDTFRRLRGYSVRGDRRTCRRAGFASGGSYA